MRGCRLTRAIGVISLLTGLGLPRWQAAAQGVTDHWLGWYAGGTLGFSWTDVDIAIPPNTFSDTYEGVTGGIVGGHNSYLTDRYRVGLKTDLSFHDVMGDIALARHKVMLLGRIGPFPYSVHAALHRGRDFEWPVQGESLDIQHGPCAEL